eukprot:9945490-Heterocapsa_arctica.AAC.1
MGGREGHRARRSWQEVQEHAWYGAAVMPRKADSGRRDLTEDPRVATLPPFPAVLGGFGVDQSFSSCLF